MSPFPTALVLALFVGWWWGHQQRMKFQRCWVGRRSWGNVLDFALLLSNGYGYGGRGKRAGSKNRGWGWGGREWRLRDHDCDHGHSWRGVRDFPSSSSVLFCRRFAGAATGAASPPSTASELTFISSALSGDSTKVKSGLEAGSRAG